MVFANYRRRGWSVPSSLTALRIMSFQLPSRRSDLPAGTGVIEMASARGVKYPLSDAAMLSLAC